MKISITVSCLTGYTALLLLSACSPPEGKLVVNNSLFSVFDIETIYVDSKCSDGWGDDYVYNVTVRPGGSSPTFELELTDDDDFLSELPRHPAQGDAKKTFAVLACFNSGTCGDLKEVNVTEDETTDVLIHDEGKPTPAGGYRYCD